jgi:phosphoenolpyruvate carboxykinase (GTP)
MRSEATAAAEHKGKTIMHDPFAMRPFFGYNFGDYLKHWLSLNQPGRTMPKIFHVNWFRKSNDGEGSFLWPGFGENIRVLEWIVKRIDNVSGIACNSPIGFIPSNDSINLTGANVTNEEFCQLFKLEKKFLSKEVDEIITYFDDNLGSSTPEEIKIQIKNLKTRIEKMDN